MIVSIASRPKLSHSMLDEMHKVRHRVFRSRLAWNVDCTDGREMDDFDTDAATYVLVHEKKQVLATARLIPGTARTMLGTTFKLLVDGNPITVSKDAVESSRFCVDTANAANDGQMITRLSIAGILRWSHASGFESITTLTDLRIERLLRRLDIPFDRLGPPMKIGRTFAVAGKIPVLLALADSVFPVSLAASELSVRVDFPNEV